MKIKLALAAIAAICIAAPALAQSFSPDTGSGNIVAGNGGQPVAQPAPTTAHRSGLHAYAKVPRETATGAPTDPAVNGGGNAGYNETILKY
jgi:opacity protein-like surface antigen